MNFKSSTFSTVCANLLFCFAVIVFFGKNTTLRLPAVGALYKEYLTGCIVLAIFYIQRIALYPKLCKGFSLRYVWICLLVALISTVMELLLVYPQVMDILTANFSRNESYYFLLRYNFFVFLRNIGILFTSFFVCEFKRQSHLCTVYEIRLREMTKEIPVRIVEENNIKESIALPSSCIGPITLATEENPEKSDSPPRASDLTTSVTLDNLVYLPISEIWYCIQMKNTLFIYSLDNKLYFRSQSLKKIKSLLGEQLFFQVSRDTLVMRKYISNVGDRFVETVNPVTKEKKSFGISDAYLTDELISWGREKVLIESEQTNDSYNEKESDPTVPVYRPDLLKQKKIKTIYTYISKHPYCKNPVISEKTKIPIGTVNRILAQLKDEGLIEYVGSKKTGGYRAIDKPKPDNNPNPQSV